MPSKQEEASAIRSKATYISINTQQPVRYIVLNLNNSINQMAGKLLEMVGLRRETSVPPPVVPLHTFAGVGEITVSDPRHVVDPRISITPHITYCVRDSNYGPMVDRRYSDFIWLVERLEANYPGVIIPPLPPKNALGRFNESFIESRRIALERFMNKVVKHRKLGKSTDLETFVRAPDKQFEVVKKETSKTVLSKTTTWIGSAISNNTVHHKPAESPKTATDVIFDGIATNIDHLHKAASEIQIQLAKYVDASFEQCIHMREFTEGLTKLEAVEEDSVLCSYLSDLSSSLRAASDGYEAFANTKLLELQYPFEEYVGLLESVHKALKRREAARLRSDAAKEQLEVSNARLLQGRSDVEQETVRRVELRIAIDEDKSAAAALAAISDDLLAEYEQFTKNRLLHMPALISNFVQIQSRFGKSMESCGKGLGARIVVATPTKYSAPPPVPQVPYLRQDSASAGGLVMPKIPPPPVPLGMREEVSAKPAIMAEADDEEEYSTLPPADGKMW